MSLDCVSGVHNGPHRGLMTLGSMLSAPAWQDANVGLEHSHERAPAPSVNFIQTTQYVLECWKGAFFELVPLALRAGFTKVPCAARSALSAPRTILQPLRWVALFKAIPSRQQPMPSARP